VSDAVKLNQLPNHFEPSAWIIYIMDGECQHNP
jgi:hypothetical protein